MTFPERPLSALRVTVTRRLVGETEARMQTLFDARLNSGDIPMDRSALVAALRDSDVLVPCVADRIDAAMLDEAGPGLRLIANFGAGTEHIDLAATRSRGITVTNTPDVFTDDTADIAMALILAVPRRLGEGLRAIEHGQWQGWGPSAMLGRSLSGKRLGLVGMGRIGQAVARRARGFGLGIVYHNRTRLAAPAEQALAAAYEPDLDRLFAEADIVSLHCPASAETRGMVDGRRLALMKPGAFLVNTARGELVDDQALFAALATGQLGGAGFDVYRNEPHIDRRFAALPNVVALPHLGSATIEGRGAAGERIIANILGWAKGDAPRDLVD